MILTGEPGVFSEDRGPPDTLELYLGRRGHWPSAEFQGSRKQEKVRDRFYLQLKESSTRGPEEQLTNNRSSQTPWSENQPSSHHF